MYIAGDRLDQRSDAGFLAVLGGHQLGPKAALQRPVVLHLENKWHYNFLVAISSFLPTADSGG